MQPPVLVVRIWAGVAVVFQLLEYEELVPAASAGCQDLSRFSVAFQLMEHEEPDSAAVAGGTLLVMISNRCPAAGTRGARSSCQRLRLGFVQHSAVFQVLERGIRSSCQCE